MTGIEQIIKECRHYNKFAQKLLYEMYAPKMKGICMRYISDSETVKDIVQEGFIKVFSNIKQYNGTGSFDGWMKRVFINTAISHLRKNRKYKEVNLENIDDSDYQEPEPIIANGSMEKDFDILKKGEINPEMVLLAELSEAELFYALQKIPEKYRIVFNMSCIENYKHEEIAEILNIDITTSRTRLLRARGIIKKELYSMCLEKLNK